MFLEAIYTEKANSYPALGVTSGKKDLLVSPRQKGYEVITCRQEAKFWQELCHLKDKPSRVSQKSDKFCAQFQVHFPGCPMSEKAKGKN